MRTREDCTVLVLGEPPWQELDCSNEPLTDDMRILLWGIDGAERRQKVAAEWAGKKRSSRQSLPQVGPRR
jgi:hypothetical protein